MITLMEPQKLREIEALNQEHMVISSEDQGWAFIVQGSLLEANLPTGKVCIHRRLLDVSFMGMREGAKGLISAR